MRKTRLTSLGANTFAVRIDSYEDGEATFRSVPELLIIIQAILGE